MKTVSSVNLTFFCELDATRLESLFSDDTVIAHLIALKARVSLGILDFSQERSAVVRRLNSAGVPVIAWQLMPREQGYWYHLGNAAEAADRYDKFLHWTRQQGLQWAGIGVDIEPDIQELEQLLNHKLKMLGSLIRRGWRKRRFSAAQQAFHNLVMRMRGDGYRVESYEFLFMVDDKKAGSTLLQRIFGVTDVPSDRQVLMLYSSFFRPFGPAVLWSYAQEAEAVGIGLTGGGVEFEGIKHQPPLNWEEFTRDLRYAGRCCRDIQIFSLEGCVQQGFLEPMHDLDWQCTNKCPKYWTPVVVTIRAIVQAALWCAAHPFRALTLLAGLLAMLYLLLR